MDKTQAGVICLAIVAGTFLAWNYSRQSACADGTVPFEADGVKTCVGDYRSAFLACLTPVATELKVKTEESAGGATKVKVGGVDVEVDAKSGKITDIEKAATESLAKRKVDACMKSAEGVMVSVRNSEHVVIDVNNSQK